MSRKSPYERTRRQLFREFVLNIAVVVVITFCFVLIGIFAQACTSTINIGEGHASTTRASSSNEVFQIGINP